MPCFEPDHYYLGLPDSGAGFFRQAINDANTNPGLDTIDFNIAPSGTQTIRPTSDRLPDITRPTLINGETQPGFTNDPIPSNRTPIIEIDSSAFLGAINTFPAAAGYTPTSQQGFYYHGVTSRSRSGWEYSPRAGH